MFRGVEPVATFFTPIAWSAYILIADAAVLALTNRSRLNDAPVMVARMALLSIPLWLIFEAYNLRLQNWVYTGVPPAGPGRFSAMAGLSRRSRRPFSRPPIWCRRFCRRCREARGRFRAVAENVLIALGVACLILPLVLPRHLAAYLFCWCGSGLSCCSTR